MTLRTIIGLAAVGLIGLYVVFESWGVRATEEDLEELRRNQTGSDDEPEEP